MAFGTVRYGVISDCPMGLSLACQSAQSNLTEHTGVSKLANRLHLATQRCYIGTERKGISRSGALSLLESGFTYGSVVG